MTVEDPGKPPLTKLIIGKQLREPHTFFFPDWTTSVDPVRGGEEWSSNHLCHHH